MTLDTFKKQVIDCLEDLDRYLVIDSEKDDDFNLPNIKDELTHIVVSGEDESEVFAVSITKVDYSEKQGGVMRFKKN